MAALDAAAPVAALIPSSGLAPGRLVDEMPPQYRALVLVGASDGLRWGEAAGLRRRDIDPLPSRIRVSSTAVELRGRVTLNTEPKTTRSKRSMPVVRSVMRRLELHLVEFVQPTSAVGGLGGRRYGGGCALTDVDIAAGTGAGTPRRRRARRRARWRLGHRRERVVGGRREPQQRENQQGIRVVAGKLDHHEMLPPAEWVATARRSPPSSAAFSLTLRSGPGRDNSGSPLIA